MTRVAYRGGAGTGSADADIAQEDQAVLDLAASAILDDLEVLGPALLLLSIRPCAGHCHSAHSAPRDWL
jgi:hypothetical protein